MRDRVLFLTLFFLLFSARLAAQNGLIVQLPPNANIDAIAERMNGAIADVIPEANQFLLNVPAAPLSLQDNDVRWMELNSGTALPSAARPTYLQAAQIAAADWYKTQPSFELINLHQALTYSSGRSVVVADLNSQVDFSHPALIGHLTSGYDFIANKPQGMALLNPSSASYLDQSSASYLDQSSASYLDQSGASYLDQSSASYLDSLNPAYGHGTLSAGIIAAIAPDAMIMPLRVFDENGSADLFMIAKAIRYAVRHGAQVINMSFGTSADSAVLRSAIAYAQERNVTLTASAGNNNSSVPQYPAGYTGVITTASTDLQDVKAPFSNFGGQVYLAAPGVNVISSFPGNLYGSVSGTSFSAPIAAGTAALLHAMGSTAVASGLAAGAIDINDNNPGYAGQLGYGRMDILNTVRPD
jgi:subtilisin family serine protease